MRPVLYCPWCGKKIDLNDDRRDTVKLSTEEIHALLPHAHRSDAPPAGAETMPDAGWLEKHLRKQRRVRRAVLFVCIIAFSLAASFLGGRWILWMLSQ